MGTCHRMDTSLRRRTLQNAGVMRKKRIDGVRIGLGRVLFDWILKTLNLSRNWLWGGSCVCKHVYYICTWM